MSKYEVNKRALWNWAGVLAVLGILVGSSWAGEEEGTSPVRQQQTSYTAPVATPKPSGSSYYIPPSSSTASRFSNDWESDRQMREMEQRMDELEKQRRADQFNADLERSRLEDEMRRQQQAQEHQRWQDEMDEKIREQNCWTHGRY